MNSTLQKYLVRKYHIFFDYLKKDKSDIMLPIYFGFECGDGWFHLLDTLMNRIKTHCSYNKVEPIKIKQVKEKFGTLRFYYQGGDDIIFGMVRMAESMSAKICEDCGTMDGVGITERRWVHVCCHDCYSKNERLSDLKWIPSKTERMLKIARLLKNE